MRTATISQRADFAEKSDYYPDSKVERKPEGLSEDAAGEGDEIRTLQYNLQLFPDFFRPANPLGTKRVDWLFEVLFPNLQREIEAEHQDNNQTRVEQTDESLHFLDFRLYQEVWGFRWDMDNAAYMRSRHVASTDQGTTTLPCSPSEAGQSVNPTSMNSGLLTCFDSRRFRLLDAEESGVESVSPADILSEPEYFQSLPAEDRVGSAGGAWRMHYFPPQDDWLFWVLAAAVGGAVSYAYAPRSGKEDGSGKDGSGKGGGHYTPEEHRLALAFFAVGFAGMALTVTALFNMLACTVGTSMFAQLNFCLFGLPNAALAFVRDGSCGGLILALVLPGVLGGLLVALWLTTRQSAAADPVLQPPEPVPKVGALRRSEGASDDDVGEERALLETQEDRLKNERSDHQTGANRPTTNKCRQVCCLLAAFYLAVVGFALAVAGFSGRYDWSGVASRTGGAGRVSKDHSWFFRRFSQAVIDDAISAKGVLAAVFEKTGGSSAAETPTSTQPQGPLFVVFNTHTQAIVDDDTILKRHGGSHPPNNGRSVLEPAEETRFRVLVNQYHELALFMHEVVEAVRRKQLSTTSTSSGGSSRPWVHVLVAGDLNFHRVNLHYATEVGRVFGDRNASHPFLFRDGGDALRLLAGSLARHGYY